MREVIRELCTYAAASAAAFAIDFTLLFALVRIGGWHYFPAAAVSFAIGGIVLYLLCIGFVFRFRRIDDPRVELPYFIGLGLVGLLINSVAMFVAVDLAGLHFLLAKLASAACTFGANYVLRRLLLFSSFRQQG